MFDVNCGCGVWPFRPTPAADAASLEKLLRAEGVTGACSYPLEALLWPDPQEANELRLPQLAESAFFVPSAVLNPTMPACLKGYRRCREEWGVPMVRLFPGCHLYDLDDPAVDALAEQAAADGVVLGIHGRVAGYAIRTPIGRPRSFPTEHVGALAERHPGLRVVAFCVGKMWEQPYFVSREALEAVDAQPQFDEPPSLPENLWIELSFFEFECSFATAVKLFSPERLLFGTNAPMFYPRSNVLKIKNSDAPESAKRAALLENAAKLLGVRA